MARAAFTAACVLALVAGAFAQPWTCTDGTAKFDLVAVPDTSDPIARCMTSVRMEIRGSDCAVRLTSLQSSGSLVPGIWAGDESLTTGLSFKRFIECPTGEGKWVPADGADKYESVRQAIIKGFAGYVYGLDDDMEYNKEIRVPDLDFTYGRLMVKRSGGAPSIVYAITESTINQADLMTDLEDFPILPVGQCDDLGHRDSQYSAFVLCLANDVAHQPCPANTYTIYETPDKYMWNEKETQFKVCGLCPAGTQGTVNATASYGCTTCPAGYYSNMGGSCIACDPGTYSNAGSSACLPCPTGTYSDGPATKECKQCPEDSYAWIPGQKQCMRCIAGVPQLCTGATCPGTASSPGTTVASVTTIKTQGGSDGCGLAGDYEIKANTKCASWRTATPTLQLGFEVAGDCSIQISPITDTTCADPTDTAEPVYGAIQMRGYYYVDHDDGDIIKISSLADTTRGVVSFPMMTITPLGGADLSMKFFAATTDPKAAENTTFVKDPPGAAVVQSCSTTLTVQGGQLVGNAPGVADTSCVDGTYFDANLGCPICPVGYMCDGTKKVPCEPNFYNAFLGSNTCVQCPGDVTNFDSSNDVSPPGIVYTTYAAAQQCDVKRVDLQCRGDPSTGYQYDLASQACVKCPAGQFREYADTTTEACKDCPAGTYSGLGATSCLECPAGEYNPSPGLADQKDITGFNCVKCADGSMPRKDGDVTESAASTTAVVTTGSTFCDACPAGTILPTATQACELCGPNTYRSGDATPENNVCKPVPAGYKLTPTDDTTDKLPKSEIMLCPKGQVSYYDAGARIPGEELLCASCASLDATLWAHTYAPRKGMTQCIPCPGGTKPLTTADATDACQPCQDGTYRDAYDIYADCRPCGAGKEVGPSSKMDCTMCRAGTYMTSARAGGADGSFNSNNCKLCEINKYRPTMGATSCLDCPRGTQTTGEGNIECTACPIGYYSNVAGQPCVPAPAGTFVNTTGAFVTTPCPRGTWNNEQANDNCNPCAPGKYSNVLGAKECKTCAAGTYSAGQATGCINCNAGYFAPSGAAACSPCKPGTYAPDTKSAQCKLCPKGFQCPTNAMKKEAPCPRGTFSNREGLRLCSPCPINTFSLGGLNGGTYADPKAVMACTKCPPGTNTRGLTGQSRCQVLRPQTRRMSRKL